jgi:Family of unknown function (DUF5320)
MPGLNGTGPRGQGPGSGWGMGPCGAGRRRGFACGMGRRDWGGGPWGFGPGGSPVYGSPQDETQALKEEAAYLQGELEAVHRRLSELEGVGG